MAHQQVLEMIRDSNNIAGRGYVLIDLRRADHEVSTLAIPTSPITTAANRAATYCPPVQGGTIRGSINCLHRASTRPFRHCTACLNQPESRRSSGTAIGLELLPRKLAVPRYTIKGHAH